MLSLTNYIRESKIEVLEQQLFESIYIYPGLLNFKSPSYSELEYDDYKTLIYQDIIQETLGKTYDFSKFKRYLNDKFGDNVQFNIDYNKHPKFKQHKTNNRLIFQTNVSVDNKDVISACDLFGYKISWQIKDKNSKGFIIEPIYFDEVSAKVNKMKYLYHVVPLDNKYKTFDNIKNSFKKKWGLKPSKREKKSSHFRRLYVFTEDVNKKHIFDIAVGNKSLNDFCLIRIKLQDYLKEFDDRQIEWFTDPNMDKAVWTREMIPYKYLEFFEIKNMQIPKELNIK